MPESVRVPRLIAVNLADRTSGVNSDRVAEWKQRVLTPENSKFIHTENVVGVIYFDTRESFLPRRHRTQSLSLNSSRSSSSSFVVIRSY